MGPIGVQKLQGVANLRAAAMALLALHPKRPRRGDVKLVDKVDMVLWNRVNPTILFFSDYLLIAMSFKWG